MPPPVAVSVVIGAAQVSVAGAAIFALGAILFCKTVLVAVAVQPLAAVAVTVYIPGAVTCKVAKLVTPVAGFHWYDTPPEAVKFAVNTVQVRVTGAAILTVGGTLFWVTVFVADAVQPFAAVTVTV